MAPVALPFFIMLAAWVWFSALILMLLIIMHAKPRSLIVRLLSGRWLESVRLKFKNFCQALDVYKGQPKLITVSVLAAFFSTAFRIAPTVLAAQSLGSDIPIIYFATFLPIIHFPSLFLMIPLSAILNDFFLFLRHSQLLQSPESTVPPKQVPQPLHASTHRASHDQSCTFFPFP